jgi:hypothetical protein
MFFRDRGGGLLLITFNEMGMQANGATFWCEAPAEKLGLSVVGFVSTRPNWFPRADMEAMQAILDATLGGRPFERVSIGLSQGGYAALKYSGLLKTQTNIAFSPQFSIDPNDIQDERFNRFFDPVLHPNMKIEPSDLQGHSVVICDPYYASDYQHCEVVKSSVSCAFIDLAFAGHGSIRPFTGANTIGAVIEAARRRDYFTIRKIYRQSKHKNLERPYLAAIAACERHPILALRIFEKYRDARIFPEWINVCFRLSKAGLGEHVLEWLEAFTRSRSEDAQCWYVLSFVACGVGDTRLARASICRALELNSQHPSYVWFAKEIEKIEK